MFKTLLNPKKLIATVAIFGVATSVLYAIPAVHSLDFAVHGWGWAALFGSLFVVSGVGSYLTGFLSGLFSVKTGGAASVVGGQVVSFLGMALSFFIAATLFPDKVTYTSGVGGLLLVLILGVAFGIDDLVQARIDGKDPEGK